MNDDLSKILIILGITAIIIACVSFLYVMSLSSNVINTIKKDYTYLPEKDYKDLTLEEQLTIYKNVK